MTGRKKGSLTEGSVQHWQSTFAVGDVRWKETTLARYKHDQRELNYAKSRRIDAMKDWVFSVRLFTAVSNSAAGQIAYLLKVERTR